MDDDDVEGDGDDSRPGVARGVEPRSRVHTEARTSYRVRGSGTVFKVGALCVVKPAEDCMVLRPGPSPTLSRRQDYPQEKRRHGLPAVPSLVCRPPFAFVLVICYVFCVLV